MEAEDEIQSDEELKSTPMTHDEKQQLSVNIQKLTGNNIRKVVEITQQGEASLKVDNKGEIEIDFRTLKLSTLRALESFVTQCLAQ